jgi:hypothetical protein
VSEAILFVPAEIQIRLEVADDGTTTVKQIVAVPDQFGDLTAANVTTLDQTSDVPDHVSDAVIKWATENTWPDPQLSADGVNIDE